MLASSPSSGDYLFVIAHLGLCRSLAKCHFSFQLSFSVGNSSTPIGVLYLFKLQLMYVNPEVGMYSRLNVVRVMQARVNLRPYGFGLCAQSPS